MPWRLACTGKIPLAMLVLVSSCRLLPMPSRAMYGLRCLCSWVALVLCCSLPAPTSQICCSPVERSVSTKWQYAPHSAPRHRRHRPPVTYRERAPGRLGGRGGNYCRLLLLRGVLAIHPPQVPLSNKPPSIARSSRTQFWLRLSSGSFLDSHPLSRRPVSFAPACP